MKKILLDNNGYNQYLNMVEELENFSLDNAKKGSTSYVDAIGDGWHDNFAFEQAVIESDMLTSKLENLLKDKKYITIVKKSNKDVIDIGDHLKIKLIFSDDDYEIMDIILTGNYMPRENEITLNSPIGKAIYLKKVTDKLEYKVNEKLIKIEILKYNVDK